MLEISIIQGSWKVDLFFVDLRLSSLQISDMKPLNLMFWKNYVCATYLISFKSHKWLNVLWCHFYASQNEWIWMKILLNSDALEV